MYWLVLQGRKQAAAEAALAERVRADSIAAELRGEVVPPEALQTELRLWEGRVVTVEGLTVTSMLGSRGFWLELPDATPFLVSISDSARARGMAVSTGQTVSVSGTILAMNDSILDAWSAARSVTEGDRTATELATYFLEARTLQVDDPPAGARSPVGGVSRSTPIPLSRATQG